MPEMWFVIKDRDAFARKMKCRLYCRITLLTCRFQASSCFLCLSPMHQEPTDSFRKPFLFAFLFVWLHYHVSEEMSMKNSSLTEIIFLC